MVKPEKFGHLHLVYHFTVPLSLVDDGHLAEYFNISSLVGRRDKQSRNILLSGIRKVRETSLSNP